MIIKDYTAIDGVVREAYDLKDVRSPAIPYKHQGRFFQTGRIASKRDYKQQSAMSLLC